MNALQFEPSSRTGSLTYVRLKRKRFYLEIMYTQSTVGKKMAAVHFTTMPREPNTAQKAQRKPYNYNICPCTKDIEWPGFEDFITFLLRLRCLGFRALRTMGKCTSRHLFSYGGLLLFFHKIMNSYTLDSSFFYEHTSLSWKNTIYVFRLWVLSSGKIHNYVLHENGFLIPHD